MSPKEAQILLMLQGFTERDARNLLAEIGMDPDLPADGRQISAERLWIEVGEWAERPVNK